MSYKDPEKRKAAQRRWYHKNKERVGNNAEARNASKKRRRTVMFAYLAEIKQKPCMDCGNEYPPYVMEFDHVRGEKLDTVSNLAREGYQRDVIDAEIAKCDLVCANCHRIRHHFQDSSPEIIEAYSV